METGRKEDYHSKSILVKSSSLKSYNAMRAMSTALRNLQWIKIYSFEEVIGSDEEETDNDEPVNYFVDATTLLPSFTKLRRLEIMILHTIPAH